MKNSPRTSTCVWKWWVWKSTCAAAKALDYARQWKKTLIIDMDWWKALARVFWTKVEEVNEIFDFWVPNLSIASVQNNFEFKTKEECVNFEEYIRQFPDDYWLACFNSMVSEFFWVSTDVVWVHRFLTLVKLVHEAKRNWYQEIVIDVEPTEWFNRLLSWIDSAARSIVNLSKTWLVKLSLIWTKWPDIKDFIKSEYIKDAKKYKERLLTTKKMIVWWNFSIVSIPEPDPMEQALNDVLNLVEKIKWRLVSIIVNNCWREVDEIEWPCIQDAQEVIDNKPWSQLIIIPHTKRMFKKWGRIWVLTDIWRRINSALEWEAA